jgi:hypothetical protein
MVITAWLDKSDVIEKEPHYFGPDQYIEKPLQTPCIFVRINIAVTVHQVKFINRQTFRDVKT